MKALMIRDMWPDSRCLAVDLCHVLDTLGPRVSSSTWRVRDVWALGDSARELESLAEQQQVVSGVQLLHLAHGVYQVVNGIFSASDLGAPSLWVVVQAVDSSYYVVHSNDAVVFDAIRHTFYDVSDAESEF